MNTDKKFRLDATKNHTSWIQSCTSLRYGQVLAWTTNCLKGDKVVRTNVDTQAASISYVSLKQTIIH